MGGGQFSPGENFSRIFRGEENFSPPLFSEFWCFPCGFWCQNSNWGGKYAQNSKWGEKKRGGERPLTGGDKFSRIFLRGGKLTFPPLSLTLVHVWKHHIRLSANRVGWYVVLLSNDIHLLRRNKSSRNLSWGVMKSSHLSSLKWEAFHACFSLCFNCIF